MKQILLMYELIDISEMCYSRTDYILEQTDNSPSPRRPQDFRSSLD